VKLETRVFGYPGSAIAILPPPAIGMRPAIPVGMQQLVLTADQAALVDESAASTSAPKLDDESALMAMSLTDAKRLVAAEFERRYLVRAMKRAGGSVSEAARLSGLDRTNFRRLLQRHNLRGSAPSDGAGQ
jgi:transcriptional regulator with GAF, ATPase, and Fis domain